MRPVLARGGTVKHKSSSRVDRSFAAAPGQLEPGGDEDIAWLLRRLSASPLGTVTAIEAIVREDDRRPSNGAAGGGRPLLLLDAGRPATTGRVRRNQVSSNGISM